MTALDLDFVRKAARRNPAPEPTRSLNKMTIMQMARRTVIFTVDAAGIASLMDAAREDIPGLTSNGIVQAVANHNPDTFWAIARKDNFDIASPTGEGFLAVLPLIRAQRSAAIHATARAGHDFNKMIIVFAGANLV